MSGHTASGVGSATGIRWVQAGIVAIGLVVGAAMVVLGLWQGQVYARQGEEANATRATQPSLRLTDIAPPSAEVLDGFGRSVTFSGTYDVTQQVFVPIAGTSTYRVLTPLLQADGSAVPVVRGVVDHPTAPPPPTGTVDQVGVLAPSEASSLPGALPADQIPAVELAAVAQRWSWPLIGGYVTLDPASATAQGLAPATPTLPRSDGRIRNGAYAVQWWIFAAFAMLWAVKMARDVGRPRLDRVADDTDLPLDDRSATT